MNTETLGPAGKDLLVDVLILQEVINRLGLPSSQTNNYISCLRVLQIERELDCWINRLKSVDDSQREELARNLSTLVMAPDSESTKEKVLKSISGQHLGYRPKSDRDDAREVHARLDHDKVQRECERIRRGLNAAKVGAV